MASLNVSIYLFKLNLSHIPHVKAASDLDLVLEAIKYIEQLQQKVWELNHIRTTNLFKEYQKDDLIRNNLKCKLQW